MLSAQIDELRKMADGQATYRDARSVMLQAADTIWELRDDLQRTNAENAKLREELAGAPKCETCEAMLDCDECLRADVSHKERRQLSVDNAKLREQAARLFDRAVELVAENAKLRAENAKLLDMRDTWTENDAKLRELVRDMYEMAYPEYPSAFAAAFADRMRELGVDADA
jgi:hypothetical protein